MFKCPVCESRVGENEMSCPNCGAPMNALVSVVRNAKAGDPEAQAGLGALYRQGMYVDLDYDKSYYWTKKAAEAGQAEAQGALGCMYATGMGVSVNYDLALSWTKKAVNSGSDQAKVELAKFYFKGEGTEQNLVRAIYWLIEARNAGVVEAANILDNLGVEDAHFLDEDTMLHIRKK